MGYNSFMTIHHDKLAYGKLQPTSEELSEEEILKMLAEIEEGGDGETKKEEDKNNKKISDVPLFADSTGKRHPLYTIIVMLRKEKENLDKSTIQLLDSYGMTWGRDKTDLNTLVKTILIPWCDKNGKKIPDINKTDKEIYALVSKLKRKKELLTEETLALLNDYGINDERRESSPKPKEILEKLKQNIEDKLIAWCKANNKQVYQIKAMLGDKHNPLYSFIINLRKVKHLLDNVTIELLNSYGMVWSGERAEFVIKRTKDKIKQNAKTKLIPWCVKNKISISQMLSTEPEYSIVKNLREIEDDLDEDFVNLLNNYGMVWKNDLINGRRANHKVLEGRIKNELIYWCKINNKTLKQIPSHDENGDIHIKELHLGEYGLQGWTLEEIMKDVMGMESTTSDLYAQTMKEFDNAMYEENIPVIKEKYEVLCKMLHPQSTLRQLLKIQMAGMEE